MIDPNTCAARDGRRPAAEETWSCPNCGRPATAFISFRRAIACGACRWIFTVDLHRLVGDDQDLYATAKQVAEQEG